MKKDEIDVIRRAERVMGKRTCTHFVSYWVVGGAVGRSLVRPRHRLGYNVKMNLIVTECDDVICVQLAPDRAQQRYFVDPVISFWGTRHETKKTLDQLGDRDPEQ
jgi:hypothetical protein